MEREIVVLADVNAVAREAANRLVEQARESIAARGRFTLALSGGSTPRALFALLASEAYRQKIDWNKTIVYWSDERCVPPDHVDSNYRLAHETLLSKAPIPAGNVHRLRGEIKPEQAALEYEQIIRREMPAQVGVPVFDLILLGLGPDGHTASLFPGTAVLHEKAKLIAANFVPKLNAYRLTFTPPLINAASEVMFLIAGADKADALRAVLEGEFKPDALPAQIVMPTSGQLTWLVDRAAGARLQRSA
jgi:6-phosphogluconolactonase